MKYGVYSIYDKAAGVYTAPTIDISDASAVRGFQHAFHNEDSVMYFQPADFALYQVATFDVESGLMEPVVPPAHLCTGLLSEV